MKSKFVSENITYDGTQLRSLYNYLNHDLQGDSILSFVGPCRVDLSHMVDGEDKKANARICSDGMVHFLMEIFHQNLFSAVCLQRLFADLVISTLKALSSSQEAKSLFRQGDDVFLGSKKLSISIATSSPLSQLIHFAVNTTNKGTPVETLCLADLGVEPKIFAEKMLEVFVSEFNDIRQATTKVHWVK